MRASAPIHPPHPFGATTPSTLVQDLSAIERFNASSTSSTPSLPSFSSSVGNSSANATSAAKAAPAGQLASPSRVATGVLVESSPQLRHDEEGDEVPTSPAAAASPSSMRDLERMLHPTLWGEASDNIFYASDLMADPSDFSAGSEGVTPEALLRDPDESDVVSCGGGAQVVALARGDKVKLGLYKCRLSNSKAMR